MSSLPPSPPAAAASAPPVASTSIRKRKSSSSPKSSKPFQTGENLDTLYWTNLQPQDPNVQQKVRDNHAAETFAAMVEFPGYGCNAMLDIPNQEMRHVRETLQMAYVYAERLRLEHGDKSDILHLREKLIRAGKSF